MSEIWSFVNNKDKLTTLFPCSVLTTLPDAVLKSCNKMYDNQIHFHTAALIFFIIFYIDHSEYQSSLLFEGYILYLSPFISMLSLSILLSNLLWDNCAQFYGFAGHFKVSLTKKPNSSRYKAAWNIFLQWNIVIIVLEMKLFQATVNCLNMNWNYTCFKILLSLPLLPFHTSNWSKRQLTALLNCHRWSLSALQEWWSAVEITNHTATSFGLLLRNYNQP